MHLIAYASEGARHVGVIEGDDVFEAGEDIFNAVRGARVGELKSLRLLPPVVPTSVICVGLNYRDHAAEAGLVLPSSPLLFAKLTSALIGDGDVIEIPSRLSAQIDYEAELAVVIGRKAHKVAVDRALEYVFGYTCFNDVSARDLQVSDGQWTRAKSFDTFGPIGPIIVTRDEVPDPQSLSIRCLVNGVTLQDGNTADMVFSVAELVSYASQAFTLRPGDIIATGTPHGVGVARNPQVFLHPGDSVSVEISGIGVLTNTVGNAT